MVVMLALPSAAAAKDCSAYKPFVRNGVSWVVYTFVEPNRAQIACSKARRITANAMRGRKVIGWQCSRPRQRCVRGGTYVDDYGFRQWKFLVGWHVAD